MTDAAVFTLRNNTLRLHGKIPGVYHIDKSYPMRLRDGTLSRLKKVKYFSNFKFSTNKMKVIQVDNLPFCGVYLLQELNSSDGDADIGQIRFRTMARLGFSIIVANNDSDAAEYDLDKANEVIRDALFCDPSWYNNKSYKIQGVTSGSSQHVFGTIGSDNETPIAELRYEITCDLGTITYEPRVPDMLEVIHVKTAFPAGGTQGEQDATQQVSTEYDMEQ